MAVLMKQGNWCFHPKIYICFVPSARNVHLVSPTLWNILSPKIILAPFLLMSLKIWLCYQTWETHGTEDMSKWLHYWGGYFSFSLCLVFVSFAFNNIFFNTDSFIFIMIVYICLVLSGCCTPPRVGFCEIDNHTNMINM